MKLCQYMTPAWAADLLIERHFADLTGADLALEPSCGTGAFLRALADRGIPAFGVEADPAMAAKAEAMTGGRVLIGDFRTIRLDDQPTVIVGNPPFQLEVVDGFLRRAAALLPEEGRCGFILPAYAFQTHGRVIRWNDLWSLACE